MFKKIQICFKLNILTYSYNIYLGCLDIFLIINFLYAVFKVHSLSSFELNGDNEIRTRDLLLARQALSQLSYTPIGLWFIFKSGLKWTRTTDLTLIRRAL